MKRTHTTRIPCLLLALLMTAALPGCQSAPQAASPSPAATAEPADTATEPPATDPPGDRAARDPPRRRRSRWIRPCTRASPWKRP